VLIREFSSFLDVIGGENSAGKIRLNDVLQSSDFGMI
jgi:hypothetical protein